MNYKLASMTLALAGALAFAGVGYAQSPNGQQQSADQQQMPPATNGTAQMPPSSNMGNGMNNGMGNGMNNQSSSDMFSQEAGSKGYITRQDAQQDTWLSNHFDQCDTNRDGRVDRAEYSQCRQQDQGTMSNPPATGSTS